MNREDRLQIFEARAAELLSTGSAGSHVTFEAARQPDHWVLLVNSGKGVTAEVGRPAWPSRARQAVSLRALGCLGFEPSASGSRFVRSDIPPEPRRLACMAELLFGGAYGLEPDWTVVARTSAGPAQRATANA